MIHINDDTKAERLGTVLFCGRDACAMGLARAELAVLIDAAQQGFLHWVRMADKRTLQMATADLDEWRLAVVSFELSRRPS